MMKTFFTRLLIVFCWVSCIFGALYLPKTDFFLQDQPTINVFTWGDILDPKVISSFEKETGIKINLSYYSSNEELLVKLKATKGEGYDLIIPSDYTVDQLIKEHLLKKIDKTQLKFWSDIHPNLLGHSFDPCNHYSIPFTWEIFLLGINKDYFNVKDQALGWELIFDQNIANYKIAMTNDPLEATLFASFYLFGPKSFLNFSEVELVKNLLITQKNWVEAYASFRGDYFLATGNCQVAVASSSYLWRTLKLFPAIDFVIPSQGTFISIENLALPKVSRKDALVYKLINYLFTEDSVRSHFETFGFFPSTLQSVGQDKLYPKLSKILFASEEDFKKFHFIQEIMPQQQMNDIWIEVKSGKY